MKTLFALIVLLVVPVSMNAQDKPNCDFWHKAYKSEIKEIKHRADSLEQEAITWEMALELLRITYWNCKDSTTALNERLTECEAEKRWKYSYSNYYGRWYRAFIATDWQSLHDNLRDSVDKANRYKIDTVTQRDKKVTWTASDDYIEKRNKAFEQADSVFMGDLVPYTSPVWPGYWRIDTTWYKFTIYETSLDYGGILERRDSTIDHLDTNWKPVVPDRGE